MSKYWLVAWIWCCLSLAAIFLQRMQHQNRVDEIFDQYEKDMEELHKDFNHLK